VGGEDLFEEGINMEKGSEGAVLSTGRNSCVQPFQGVGFSPVQTVWPGAEKVQKGEERDSQGVRGELVGHGKPKSTEGRLRN